MFREAGQSFCYPAPDLRNLQGVRQPIMENVAFVRRHYLRNPRETAKSGCIQNAIAVALKGTPIVDRFVAEITVGSSDCSFSEIRGFLGDARLSRDLLDRG